MSRHEYRRRASLGKCHRGGRCRWVRGVPADRPASVASLSALLAVSRPQTSQATPLTREQRLRCVLCHLTCLHPKHHVAHPFVWHDVRSGVVFDRGCHQCEHVSLPLVSLVHRHNPGAEVAATPPLSYFAAVDLQVNRAAARDLYPVPACGCGGSFSPSAGPRDAPRPRPEPPGAPRTSEVRVRPVCGLLYYIFPVHAPNRTQHAPSISYRCRSRRSICRIGYSRAYPAVLRAGNPIHAAVRCPAPYAVVRVVSQMISMEPTRLRIAWLTSRFLRDAP
jgi:hypothetical protein